MNWYKFIKAHSEGSLGYKREFAGLIVNVENAAGTIRMGIDSDGEEWRVDMKYDYGFINKIKGEDDEGLDVYLGPNQDAKKAYVIHQVKPDSGKYDEDKVMLGFDDEGTAKKAYLDHYDSPDFFGDMTTLSMETFKRAVQQNDIEVVRWKKKK